MTEEDIIIGVRQGGKARDAAVKALYLGQAQAMLRFFVHQGASADEAKDILQDTVVKILRNVDSFQGTGAARAWLWQIARHCLLDFHDRRSRHAAREVAVDSEQWAKLTDTTVAPQACAIDATVDDCVAKGLITFGVQMPDRAYALTLQMDGLRIEAISQQIGRSVAATKEYLSQCRKKVQPFIAHCVELLGA
jgi:DNA-directed RNA polymerase specialized sigma24 family protein